MLCPTALESRLSITWCDVLDSGVRGGGQEAATSLNSHKESLDVHQDRFMAVVGFYQVIERLVWTAGRAH